MLSRIHYTKPSITEKEIAYATDAATNGWGDRCYEYIQRFEEGFKTRFGSKYALATSSCTGAMHLGLAALGVGPGDEVILADTNWIATVAPVVHLGATPVFVDIDPETWCLNPYQVEIALTKKTKAIIATHLYGNVCDLSRLLDIEKNHGIPIIEDAAEALGSTWNGWQVGTFGKFGVFSFHGTKTITTGEGGMFVTDDPKLYETVLTLSNHGRSKTQKKQFWPDMLGFKYKMSNVQAAIGCAQLERFDEILKRKREILAYYRKHLLSFGVVKMNPEQKDVENGAWMPTVVFDKSTGATREAAQKAFAEENIDARVFFWPLSGLPMFTPKTSNVWAWDIPNRAMNLPSYVDMTEEDLKRVEVVIYKLSGVER